MKLTITRRARWELNRILASVDLRGEGKGNEKKPTDLATIRAYNRAFLALRLGRIVAAIDIHNKQGSQELNPEISDDDETRHVVDLEGASAELILSLVVPKILVGWQARFLYPLIDQIDVWKSTGTEPVIEEGLSPIPEDEKWVRDKKEKADHCATCGQPFAIKDPHPADSQPSEAS